MKQLLDLIKRIDATKLGPKEKALRRLVLKTDWDSDSELADKLWPNDKHGRHYLRLTKGRIINHAIEAAYSIPSSSTYQERYAECYKEYFAIVILKSLGRLTEVQFLAERLIKKALKFDVTEVVLGVSNILHLNYGSIIGDEKRSFKYLQLAEEYEGRFLAENRARRYFVDIAGSFTHSRVGDPNVIEKAERYSEVLRDGLGENSGYLYHYYYYYIDSISAELKKDKANLLRICETALSFFRSKNYDIPLSIRFCFAFERRISLALYIKDYGLAKKTIDDNLALVDQSDFNQSVCLIYKAIAGFHSKELNMVCEAIEQSKSLRKVQQLGEQWKIIEAFYAFFTGGKFRSAKFLNELPIYSKDKSGVNITIIIIQVLFLIKEGKLPKLIDRLEALSKYRQRYLNNQSRSQIFIQMILALDSNRFHPLAVTEHVNSKRYLSKMEEAIGNADFEIVPYEILWDHIIQLLAKHKGISMPEMKG